MPNWIWYHVNEKDFEDAKGRYRLSLSKQDEYLRKTTCPLIGKPCIKCECTSYLEPIPPYKTLVEGVEWFSRWFAKLSNKPFTEPYNYHYWLAQCHKNVFKENQFIVSKKV